MKTKKILSATCTTLLTIAFYTWMFHLGTVQKIRSNDSGGDTPKRLGSQPPDKAFYIQEPQYFCDSVLKINTSTDANYVIKVVDPAANEVILVIYLPAGDSREIGIPSGTYEIRYTSGTEWFGVDEMFGTKGYFAKADKTFKFSEGSGYELTLYRVPNGNLHTLKIRKEAF